MSDFAFDVFLSYSSKDRAVVRILAERLRKDGLRVWFEDGSAEEGLERSRVLVLCLSANALGEEWARLEAGTFRFRDAEDKERRFVPLRLDEAPVPESLAQFVCINWLRESREYSKLFDACRAPTTEAEAAREQVSEKAIRLDSKTKINPCAFSPDGKRVLTGHVNDSTVRLWDGDTGRCLRILKGHTGQVQGLAWSTDGRRVVSGSVDRTVRLWDLEGARCLRVLEGHTQPVIPVAWSGDERRALSGSGDSTVRLWDMETGLCLRVLEGHSVYVSCVEFSPDQRRALSASLADIIRLWDL